MFQSVSDIGRGRRTGNRHRRHAGFRDHVAHIPLGGLGHHAFDSGDHDAAVAWWKEAHALFPENWTYKRQAWTLESTPEGADSDKAQEVQDVYGTTWADEFLAMGGGATYVIAPRL